MPVRVSNVRRAMTISEMQHEKEGSLGKSKSAAVIRPCIKLLLLQQQQQAKSFPCYLLPKKILH